MEAALCQGAGRACICCLPGWYVAPQTVHYPLYPSLTLTLQTLALQLRGGGGGPVGGQAAAAARGRLCGACERAWPRLNTLAALGCAVFIHLGAGTQYSARRCRSRRGAHD